MVLLGQLGFVLAVGGFIGCQPAIMVEAVPADVRCTAIALGYNVTLGVVGGLSPLVATWLVARTANDYSPAFMIMAAAAVSFLAVLSLQGNFSDAPRLTPFRRFAPPSPQAGAGNKRGQEETALPLISLLRRRGGKETPPPVYKN